MTPDPAPTASAQTFTVLDIHTLPSPDPARMGKYDRIVAYQMGDGRRYTLRLPDESFSEAALVAAVKAAEKDRGQWLNRPFRV